MTEVSIDDKDLEALLFASGAVNSASVDVRKALKRNPQFEEVEPRLTDAIKRAGDAWRKAGRAKEWPERFQVSAADVRSLREFQQMGAAFRKGAREEFWGQAPRSLIAKGLIELGVWRETIIWTNSGEEQFENVERRFRLTEDGIGALRSDALGTHDFSNGAIYCGSCGVSRFAVQDGLVSSRCGGPAQQMIADQAIQS